MKYELIHIILTTLRYALILLVNVIALWLLFSALPFLVKLLFWEFK
ncbi:hypothetical protein [Flavobacterium sp.]